MILKDYLPGVFVKILENNNKSNNLEENLILVETIPIKEYTYNRLVVSFGGKLWIICLFAVQKNR